MPGGRASRSPAPGCWSWWCHSSVLTNWRSKERRNCNCSCLHVAACTLSKTNRYTKLLWNGNKNIDGYTLFTCNCTRITSTVHVCVCVIIMCTSVLYVKYIVLPCSFLRVWSWASWPRHGGCSCKPSPYQWPGRTWLCVWVWVWGGGEYVYCVSGWKGAQYTRALCALMGMYKNVCARNSNTHSH